MSLQSAIRNCPKRGSEAIAGRLPSMRTAYPTDLSDAEWSYLEPYLPAPKTLGRPKIHHTRKVLDAIFYILKSGCAWRLLPRDLERPGRPFTTTSEPCASTSPGRSCIPRYESVCAHVSCETPSRARAHSG